MHIYILPQCSTTAASVLNSAGMDAQFERSCCAISRGILSKSRRRAFYGSKGKIELTVVTGKLVVLSQAFGFLYHNNLYVVNGIEVSRIASP